MNKQSEVIFSIPYPPTKKGRTAFNKRFGLNAYWSGKHYRARATDAQDIHNLTYLAMKKARIRKKPFEEPVMIIFEWDDGLDCSNHAALAKMIEDSMKGWVIKDDSRRWVKEIRNKFWDGNCIRVTVREYKEEDNGSI